ncbi:sulfite:cytochrome C oxidoreductase subunit B [Caldimicrobium thiodismutans]|jgi:cytochrome c553|uniref:Sulfite:cytochrome C oxidoreductase subunit B n=1 Tax=Caldimicrobium thiodismutans TaxID=1653476 RepID=A0A0U4W003_9BACT|nr:hypothetical protein [Caldimicrobium thiodismutans]BAU22493.1 sulfite:cytochrome C oxidoreductase subunit B [Caldimicrobium thiodismutans]
MKKIIIWISGLILVSGVSWAISQDSVKSIELPPIQVELKAGKGKEKVETYCNICHSTDYIIMQPKFSKNKWSEIVNKMIKVYGAPIPEPDVEVIINYLTINYGTK